MKTQTLCETRWDWMRDRVRESWPDLPAQDLDAVAGDYNALVELLRDRYGHGLKEGAARLDEMVNDS
ncbi:hypothetical protein [Roseospira goensis]|uniref:CsbD family protein n=1 Tax=Roseospira goensis TaxID=391922 RepID=A0A7W6S2Z7_9PROT|nr:hypothetical protein [Roseospira goensis]MBB4287812.1 hypothetical protein [Roseospira goensis]